MGEVRSPSTLKRKRVRLRALGAGAGILTQAETSESVLNREGECKAGASVQVPGGHGGVYSLPGAAVTNEHREGG